MPKTPLGEPLAHELNQPLTAIPSNTQAEQRFLAQSPPRVDKLVEILADIVKSDGRAEAVIHVEPRQDPLGFARVRAIPSAQRV